MTEIKGFSLYMFALFLLGVLVNTGCCPRDCDFAVIGKLSIMKVSDHFSVDYYSAIDNVHTSAAQKDHLDLKIVRVAMDAGIDKNFAVAKVDKKCIDLIRNAYSNTTGVMFTCYVYGRADIAYAVMDRNLYTEDMIELYDQPKCGGFHTPSCNDESILKRQLKDLLQR